MQSKEALQTGLEELSKHIDIQWDYKPKSVDPGNGRLYIKGLTGRHSFVVEQKNTLKGHQLAKLEEQNEAAGSFLLAAIILSPKIKKALRKNHINYIEANGNCYIRAPQLYLFINDNRPIKITKPKANRAFTKTGLKVIFHLLIDSSLFQKTQREIAEITGVSLGTVPQVLNGLVESKYLVKTKRTKYFIPDFESLLDKWISHYGDVLRPTLFRGNFKLLDKATDWRTISIHSKKTVWGEEPAGALLTGYLRPANLCVYTREERKELVKNYKMLPDKKGDIQVYNKFWNKKYDLDKTTPALLVYADLMLTGDSRCMDAAKMIFDEKIKPNV